MKISAIGVVASNLRETAKFYETLGFKFSDFPDDEDHIEAHTESGDVRLMIDSQKIIHEIIGEMPHPSNTSIFAIELESSQHVNELAEKIKSVGFNVVNEPWDAPWGQRYCIVQDPFGNKIDLFASL